MSDSNGSSEDERWPDHLAIPELFLCPLTKGLMKHPVIDREGNSYDKDAILSYLKRRKGKGVSPITKNPLRESDLVDNRGLKKAIDTALKNAIEEQESTRKATMQKSRRFRRIANPLSSSMTQAAKVGQRLSLSGLHKSVTTTTTSRKGRNKSEGDDNVFDAECKMSDEMRRMSIRTESSAEDDDAPSEETKRNTQERIPATIHALEGRKQQLKGRRGNRQAGGLRESRREERESMTTGNSGLDARIAAFMQGGAVGDSCRGSMSSIPRNDSERISRNNSSRNNSDKHQQSRVGGQKEPTVNRRASLERSKSAQEQFEERLRRKLQEDLNETAGSQRSVDTDPDANNLPKRLDSYEERLQRKVSASKIQSETSTPPIEAAPHRPGLKNQPTSESMRKLDSYDERLQRKVSEDRRSLKQSRTSTPSNKKGRGITNNGSSEIETAPTKEPDYFQMQDERKINRGSRRNFLDQKVESMKALRNPSERTESSTPSDGNSSDMRSGSLPKRASEVTKTSIEEESLEEDSSEESDEGGGLRIEDLRGSDFNFGSNSTGLMDSFQSRGSQKGSSTGLMDSFTSRGSLDLKRSYRRRDSEESSRSRVGVEHVSKPAPGLVTGARRRADRRYSQERLSASLTFSDGLGESERIDGRGYTNRDDGEPLDDLTTSLLIELFDMSADDFFLLPDEVRNDILEQMKQSQTELAQRSARIPPATPPPASRSPPSQPFASPQPPPIKSPERNSGSSEIEAATPKEPDLDVQDERMIHRGNRRSSIEGYLSLVQENSSRDEAPLLDSSIRSRLSSRGMDKWHNSAPLTYNHEDSSEDVDEGRLLSMGVVSEDSARHPPAPAAAAAPPPESSDNMISWDDLDGALANAQFMSLRVANDDARKIQNELEAHLNAGDDADDSPSGGGAVGPSITTRRARGGRRGGSGQRNVESASEYVDKIDSLLEVLGDSNKSRFDVLKALNDANGDTDKALCSLLGFG